MADSKITALTSISTSTDPANDPLVIVDVSDTSMAATGTTKKVTLNQLLGASGTATLASATITGDLTVRTNKLFVNATGVGIGNTGPLSVLTISSQVGARLSVRTTDATFGTIAGGTAFDSLNDAGNALVPFGCRGSTVTLGSSAGIGFQIDASGNATWSNVGGVAGTAMTLNATGLGVGVSPAAKVHVVGGAAQNPLILDSTGYNHCVLKVSGTNRGQFYADATNCFAVVNSAGSATPFVVTDTGNVGIGVTLSAWNSSYRGLQLGAGGAISAHTSASLPWLVATSNSFINSAGDWKFINNGYSTRYLARGDDGTQSWWTSNNGSAGGTVTFTQAMTLDASGNLLVGKTAIGTTVGVEVRPDGYIIATRSASTDAAAFTNAVYSTGASAYRFYVGLGGTVYATNTTISAISDARLKENVQDIDVGLGAILALKPRKFDWKEGKGKNIKGDRGFIAQEFEQVFPQLVDQWADEAPEGEAPYKSVRQDLIPVLVKAIQELTARVQTLETR